MSTLARKKIKRKNALGNRSDLGWEHGVEVGSRQVQCNYCKEIHSGGIYRLKHHLAGTRKQPLHSSKGKGRHIGSMDKFVAKKKKSK